MSVRRLELRFGRLTLEVSEVEEDSTAAAGPPSRAEEVTARGRAARGGGERSGRQSSGLTGAGAEEARNGGASASGAGGEAAAVRGASRSARSGSGHEEPRPEPTVGGEAQPRPVSHRRPPRAAAATFYVVFAAPAAYEYLIGIHQCSWQEFSSKLPGGAIVGSPIRDGKKFGNLEDALAYFWRRNSTASECIVHQA